MDRVVTFVNQLRQAVNASGARKNPLVSKGKNLAAQKFPLLVVLYYYFIFTEQWNNNSYHCHYSFCCFFCHHYCGNLLFEEKKTESIYWYGMNWTCDQNKHTNISGFCWSCFSCWDKDEWNEKCHRHDQKMWKLLWNRNVLLCWWNQCWAIHWSIFFFLCYSTSTIEQVNNTMKFEFELKNKSEESFEIELFFEETVDPHNIAFSPEKCISFSFLYILFIVIPFSLLEWWRK